MKTLISILIIVFSFGLLDLALYFSERLQSWLDYKNGKRSCARWIFLLNEL